MLCAVEFAPLQVLVANEEGRAWIADFTEDNEVPEWTQVPDMETGRELMACGAAASPSGGIDIMAIGGRVVGEFMSTVEVFNTNTRVKRKVQ